MECARFTIEREVDTVIIACTDLNVVASEDFVASSQCLAKAVVRMYVENIRGSNEYILLAIVFRKIMFRSKFINSPLVVNLSL